jgi:hypothetical protein
MSTSSSSSRSRARPRCRSDARQPPSQKCFPLELGCKPGSVPTFVALHGWRSFIWAVRCRAAQATNSGSGVGVGAPAGCPAIHFRSCSRWGLPCPSCHQEGGVLLPHHFTLTLRAVARTPGGLFSVALSFESPRLAVSQHPAQGARTFLDGASTIATAFRAPAGSGGSIARVARFLSSGKTLGRALRVRGCGRRCRIVLHQVLPVDDAMAVRAGLDGVATLKNVV